ncbi:MAG: zinc ribbon domain-containing protein [Ruminococcus sp.]|nr:zinc ribbon domain-containing protein [Ruminococcus sp.]
MGMQLNSLKCPECAATISIEEGRTQCFCSYCGAKIAITNENEFVYRNVDEADVKRAETDRIVKLRQIKFFEKMTKTRFIICAIGLLLTIIGIICGYASGDSDSPLYMLVLIGMLLLFGGPLYGKDDNNDNDSNLDGKIKVPSGISNYENKNYAVIQAIFISAGFKNVQCIPLNDLAMGLLKKKGTVESITINGETISSSGRRFLPDASIIISYHSFPQKTFFDL